MIQFRFKLILLLLIIQSGFLWSHGFRIGGRAFFSGGYPSGKGLWDWTDTDATGTLFWGAGGGAGLVICYQSDLNLILESGINYVKITAGQKLDDASYLYLQESLEIPLMFKTRLPFKSHWYLGAGPALILLPADAIRTYRAEGADQRESSAPQKRMMAALLVGLDYKFPSRETFEMLLSLNFVHPVSSPGYSWEEGSSGSIRINRLDLAATLLYKAEWKKR